MVWEIFRYWIKIWVSGFKEGGFRIWDIRGLVVGWCRKGRGWGYGCGMWVGYRVWIWDYEDGIGIVMVSKDTLVWFRDGYLREGGK